MTSDEKLKYAQETQKKLAVHACLEEAQRIKNSLYDSRTGLDFSVLPSGKMHPFEKEWKKTFAPMISGEKEFDIKKFSKIYSSALELVYQSANELDSIQEARELAQSRFESIGLDTIQETMGRQIEIATKTVGEMEILTNDSAKQDRFIMLSKSLTACARFGLAVANLNSVEQIKENGLHGSIKEDSFLKPEIHLVRDIPNIRNVIEARSFVRDPIVIPQESALFKSATPSIRTLINTKVNTNYKPTNEQYKKFKGIIDGEEGIGGIDERTHASITQHFISEACDKKRCGIQLGLGIIRSDEITAGLPFFGITNYVLAAENFRREAGMKGKSTIIVSQPHEALNKKLGPKNTQKRVDKTLNTVRNFISNINTGAKYFQVCSKDEVVKLPNFKPIDTKNIDKDKLEEVNTIVPDGKDAAYFLMEAEVIEALRENHNNRVKLSWVNGGKKCDESKFDVFYQALKKADTADQDMSFVYVKAPTTFSSKTIAPYALSPEEAEQTITVEDFEKQDQFDDTYLNKIEEEHKNSFSNTAKLKAAAHYGHVGVKLAHLMLKKPESKSAQQAIDEMLTTIRNVRIITDDYKIGNIADGETISTQPEHFGTTHKFICENSIYIYENYLAKPNEEVLARHTSNGHTQAKNIVDLMPKKGSSDPYDNFLLSMTAQHAAREKAFGD